MNSFLAAKQGNIFISIGLVFLIIIFLSAFLVFYQINIIAENIRSDLFYAAKSAVLSFDLQELAYGKYKINEEQTKQVIQYLLNKNFVENNESIIKIVITKIKIQNKINEIVLKIEVQVTFDSVINLAGKSEHTFKLKDNVKISLLDYKAGD